VKAGQGKRPNVIFILTDDLGYGDVGVFGQNARRAEGKPAHSTPNLDAMAADGVRLTHHYCPAPVCAPSRASLMLGVHQGHANVRDNQFDKALEENHTIATVLKQAGYATAAIGKWGLQGKPNGKPPAWPAHPLNRGFDYYYGYIRHADGHEHYPKEGLWRGAKEVWDGRTEVSAGLDGCYTTDLFAARAKQWIIDQNRGHGDQPFFLYLAFDTPHAAVEYPTQAYPAGKGLNGGLKWIGKPGEMINTAKGGKVDGWVHPDYAKTNWPDVYMRYATDVRRIDDAVGDVLQLLKDLKIDDQTLVVFTSDNGPSIESYVNEPYAPTFFGSYGPFDGIKRDCWEGGLRVPTIVRWPGHVGGGGRESAVATSFPDWMATLAEVAGVAAPARCDGVSLVPALTGRGEQRTPRVYVEYFHNQKTPNFEEFEPGHRGRVRRQMQALVIGDYVGVRYDVKKQSDDFEIYDAVKDPKQANNLAKRPERAALQREFKETALRVRRPDGEAKRPYDRELVPAISDVGAVKPGLLWRAYAGAWPWVPQFEGMAVARESVVEGVKVEGTEGGGRLDGLIEVPADGKYTFYLSAEGGGAELRVHEATVVDADYGYSGGKEVSGDILLKAGRHPIHLAYARRAGAGGAPGVRLEWSGPGVERGAIPARALSHGDGKTVSQAK
jgi:arylsulfatase A-like enzyme